MLGRNTRAVTTRHERGIRMREGTVGDGFVRVGAREDLMGLRAMR
jgi:hypothetical protein